MLLTSFPSTKIDNYQFNLTKVTKRFPFLVFPLLIALVVLVFLLARASPFYAKSIFVQTRSQDWKDFPFEEKEAKARETKVQGLRDPPKMVEVEVTKQGRPGILLLQVYKEFHQA